MISQYLESLEQKEQLRQQNTLNLIASENYAWPEVLQAMSSVFGNKYAEGAVGKRFYNGCQVVDELEIYAQQLACKIFGAQYANLQPLSGANANQIAYFALLNPGDTVLAMDMASGGHLTHGHAKNYSAKFYNFVHYAVDPITEQIDFNQVEDLTKKHRPKLIIAGASAYPCTIDFAKFAQIARQHEAFLLADIAHIAGLVAAKLHPSPVGLADVITMTTQKTMRGPRGGIILSNTELETKINRAVMPGIQGGPHINSIFAKAVMLEKALAKDFITYQQQTIANATALANSLKMHGLKLVANGTDNHLLIINLAASHLPLNGRQAANLLEEIGIVVNANLIPNDPRSSLETSGIRLGTPALTARGMTVQQAEQVGDIVATALQQQENKQTLIAAIKNLVGNLTN